MIRPSATVERPRLRSVGETQLHEGPAATGSGSGACSVVELGQLEVDWVASAEAVAVLRSDQGRALDMMCD